MKGRLLHPHWWPKFERAQKNFLRVLRNHSMKAARRRHYWAGVTLSSLERIYDDTDAAREIHLL